MDDRIRQLRDYFAQELPAPDADFCFRWLAACALSPILRWPITNLLGAALAAKDDRPAPDEDLVLALARLPWFRTGRIPDDLRHALAATLDRGDRRAARAALVDCFDKALREPGAPPPKRRTGLGGHLARLVSRLPEGEMSDPLLANGLRGWRAGRLLARIAALAARLPPAVRPLFEAPRLIAAGAAALAIAAAAIFLANLEDLLPSRTDRKTVTLDAVNLWLTACDLPAGKWGVPAFAPRSPTLIAPVKLHWISARPADRSIVLAEDLSVALSHDGDSATLWSLGGDGAEPVRWDAIVPEGGQAVGVARSGAGAIFARSEGGRVVQIGGKPLAGQGTPEVRAERGEVRFTRDGVLLVARRQGASVGIFQASTNRQLASIEAGRSPLLGVGADTDGRLVIARCNPDGRIEPIKGDPPVQPPVAPPAPLPGLEPGAESTEPFRMPIEDVFSISGRGTVVTGKIESGTVRNGDDVDIVGGPVTLRVRVTAVEMFRNPRGYGNAGDNVGILLRGVTRDQVFRGQALVTPGSAGATGEQRPSEQIVAPPAGNLSGAAWWVANQGKYPNSDRIEDLEPEFRERVSNFVEALRAVGATVSITATRRNAARAYLQYYAWRVSRGLTPPSQVPPFAGVEIVWDHGDPVRSRNAAREMADRFGLAFQPNMTSSHIEGRAIDMTIAWQGQLEIVDAKGVAHSVGAPHNGASNTLLHEIGATYGVRKLLADPPHWSSDGR